LVIGAVCKVHDGPAALLLGPRGRIVRVQTGRPSWRRGHGNW
jgi:hypothetical protein